MKLAASLINCAIFAVACSLESIQVAIVAGSFFLFGEVVDLALSCGAARSYRQGRHEEWRKERSVVQKFGDDTWHWLPAAGLIAMLASGAAGSSAMGIAGGILWFGRIASSLIGGVITQYVAGIPLKMTYGGWKVDRGRPRKRISERDGK